MESRDRSIDNFVPWRTGIAGDVYFVNQWLPPRAENAIGKSIVIADIGHVLPNAVQRKA